MQWTAKAFCMASHPSRVFLPLIACTDSKLCLKNIAAHQSFIGKNCSIYLTFYSLLPENLAVDSLLPCNPNRLTDLLQLSGPQTMPVFVSGPKKQEKHEELLLSKCLIVVHLQTESCLTKAIICMAIDIFCKLLGGIQPCSLRAHQTFQALQSLCPLRRSPFLL